MFRFCLRCASINMGEKGLEKIYFRRRKHYVYEYNYQSFIYCICQKGWCIWLLRLFILGHLPSYFFKEEQKKQTGFVHKTDTRNRKNY